MFDFIFNTTYVIVSVLNSLAMFVLSDVREHQGRMGWAKFFMILFGVAAGSAFTTAMKMIK